MQKHRVKQPQRQAKNLSPRWSESTTTLRDRILKEYQFDCIGHEVLSNLLDAHERMRQAGVLLAQQGMLLKDRFGQWKPNPAFEMEAVSRASVLKHAHALGVDVGELTSEGEMR